MKTDDNGAVTLTVSVLACIVLIMVTAITAAIVDVTGTASRARAAADAAALAGAGASPLTGGDGDSCAAAQQVANTAGVQVVDCEHPPVDPNRTEALRVSITVNAPTASPLTDIVDGLQASATAAVVPEETPPPQPQQTDSR